MEDICPVIPLNSEYDLNERFSDDFNGDSLDRSKWYDFYPDWKGRITGFFSPDNVRVEDGMLKLTARDVDPAGMSEELKIMGFQARSSAIVRSRERILYGFFQTRFRSMNAAVCNAFWLNESLEPAKKHVPGSFSDEIDMFEVFGKSTTGVHNIFHTTCHRVATPYMEGRICCVNTGFSNKNAKTQPFEFSQAFHTAAFLWTPDTLEWYLDGRLEYSHPNDYYHTPMRLNIDCEFLSGWCGVADSADLPADFCLEYVRVWQKRP